MLWWQCLAPGACRGSHHAKTQLNSCVRWMRSLSRSHARRVLVLIPTNTWDGIASPHSHCHTTFGQLHDGGRHAVRPLDEAHVLGKRVLKVDQPRHLVCLRIATSIIQQGDMGCAATFNSKKEQHPCLVCAHEVLVANEHKLWLGPPSNPVTSAWVALHE